MCHRVVAPLDAFAVLYSNRTNSVQYRQQRGPGNTFTSEFYFPKRLCEQIMFFFGVTGVYTLRLTVLKLPYSAESYFMVVLYHPVLCFIIL